MGAWSFKRRFRERLLQGLSEAARTPPPYPGVRPKRQTIRAERADGRDPVVGEEMSLWIEMRTPAREKLGTIVIERRLSIELDDGEIVLDGQVLRKGQRTRLARLDGFESGHDLDGFLYANHGDGFLGYVYRW